MIGSCTWLSKLVFFSVVLGVYVKCNVDTPDNHQLVKCGIRQRSQRPSGTATSLRTYGLWGIPASSSCIRTKLSPGPPASPPPPPGCCAQLGFKVTDVTPHCFSSNTRVVNTEHCTSSMLHTSSMLRTSSMFCLYSLVGRCVGGTEAGAFWFEVQSLNEWSVGVSAVETDGQLVSVLCCRNRWSVGVGAAETDGQLVSLLQKRSVGVTAAGTDGQLVSLLQKQMASWCHCCRNRWSVGVSATESAKWNWRHLAPNPHWVPPMLPHHLITALKRTKTTTNTDSVLITKFIVSQLNMFKNDGWATSRLPSFKFGGK